jgi:hypothetical protein
MSDGKIKDFLISVYDESGQILLGSESAKEVVAEFGEIVVSEGVAQTIGALFTAIAPRINGVVLRYQEKRFERNITAMVKTLMGRVDELESRFSVLSEEVQEKYRGLYVEWFMDNIIEEKQTEKVNYHTNGFINMMEDDTTDGIMLMFMETMNQLTLIDIDVLKIYSREYDENWETVCEKRGITVEQLNMIKAKLVRNGLLLSNNDNQREENIDILVEYIDKRVKEEKKKNGDVGKVRLGNVKKVQSSSSYRITKLGRDLLKKIG